MTLHPDKTRRGSRSGGRRRAAARRGWALAAWVAALATALGTAGCGKGSASGDEGPEGHGSGSAGRTAERDPRRPPTPPAAPVIVPVAAAPRPDGPLAPGTTCTTAECHGTFESASYVHGAAATGECVVCHEADNGDHTYPLRRPGNETCTYCHTTVGTAEHQHFAVTDPGCLSCHNAHVSEQRFLLPTSVSKVCVGCHVMEPATHGHAPFSAGECTACHAPHGSDNPKLLRGGVGAEECFSCHEETRDVMASAPHLHAPAVDGCTTCHSPHATDHAHALRRSVEETCYSCHADVEARITGADVPHGAVFTADKCANCHDPHAAGQPALLRDRQDVLCLQCHDRPVTARDGRTIPDMAPSVRDREFQHGPVRAGDCTACHDVHGASYSRLLRQEFSSAFYQPFDLGSYALCFECHENEIVLAERTSDLTGFRNGERNLHFVHVNRDKKGRSCITCHDIHGSTLPRHMAESVPFEGSQWSMPIGFEMTDTGGRCAPACHEPMEYRRETGVDPDEPPKGGGP